MEVKVKNLKKYILFIVVFSVISIIAYNNRYTKNGWYHIDLGDFEDNFETNKDEDKEILRSIAARNVYKKILGND